VGNRESQPYDGPHVESWSAFVGVILCVVLLVWWWKAARRWRDITVRRNRKWWE
jgi:hypothetical protein